MNLVSTHKKQAKSLLDIAINDTGQRASFTGILTPRATDGSLAVLQYFRGELIGAVIIPDEKYMEFIKTVMTAVPAPKKESNDAGSRSESNPS